MSVKDKFDIKLISEHKRDNKCLCMVIVKYPDINGKIISKTKHITKQQYLKL